MSITSDSGRNKSAALAKDQDKALNGLKQSAAAATAGFEEAEAKIGPSLETLHRGASNALLFGHNTLGAYARSTQIWADGLEDLAKQSATLARTSIAEASEHLKKLAAAEFETDALEIQTRIMRASAEKAGAEASRLANAYIRLTEKAFAATVGMAAEPARKG